MGRKTPPPKVEAAKQKLRRSGSLLAAAKAVGVPESTLRGAIGKEELARIRDLHARETEAEVQRMRVKISTVSDLVAEMVVGEVDAGEGVTMADLRAALDSLAKASDSIVRIADRGDKRRSAALTRQKTRAEIAAIARNAGPALGGQITVVMRADPDDGRDDDA